MSELVVVKIGGSLYDLPDLGQRLRRWLDSDPCVQPPASVLLVPGGGPFADVIRAFDQRFGLGDERAHWLALRALSLNAHILADLLPQATVVEQVSETVPRLSILDSFAFLRADEQRHGPGFLPHVWEATSDSVAARVAAATGARRLILLKSTEMPFQEGDWEEAGRRGFVDPVFASILRQATHDLEVSAINFRTNPPERSFSPTAPILEPSGD